MGIKVIYMFFRIPTDGGDVQSFQFQTAIFTVTEITRVQINAHIFCIL